MGILGSNFVFVFVFFFIFHFVKIDKLMFKNQRLMWMLMCLSLIIIYADMAFFNIILLATLAFNVPIVESVCHISNFC